MPSHATPETGHPLWNHERLAELLWRCGRHALLGRQHQAWKLKEDGSLVTELDAQNEVFLREQLTALIPGSRFIGEETLQDCSEEYLQQCYHGDCWIVDPIDGTAPFAHGFPLWAVSIGLMHDGCLVDGGVLMPSLGQLLVSNGPHVLYATGCEPLREERPPRLTRFQPEPQAWSPGGMIELGQAVVRTCQLTLPNPLLATGSAVQAISSVLLGDAMLYVGKFKLYDIAGLLPLMHRLGVQGVVPGCGMLEPNIVNGVFELAPQDKHRWSLRATARIGWPRTLQNMDQQLAHIE